MTDPVEEFQDILVSMMLRSGRLKQEQDASFYGKKFSSRGFYIVDYSGRWHLHHDGLVKDGVHADSDKPAFWDSEKECVDFFNAWKESKTKSTKTI